MIKSGNKLNNFLADKEVNEILAGYYSISVKEIKHLEGEIDQNFYIRSVEGKEYVFKIANPRREMNFLEAQINVMEHLRNRICCQKTVANTKGKKISFVKTDDNKDYRAWLITYLPGTFFAEIKVHSPELLRDFGRVLGKMDQQLVDFFHPGAYRYLEWDAKNAGDMYELTGYIQDFERRRVVRYFLQQFQTYAVSSFPKLRSSIIYNDANDYNILVDADGQSIKGIIDFGDMVHTYIVSEPAIAIAYAIHGKDNPLQTAAYIVNGFHQEFPLTEKELEVLFYFIAVRLCMTLCNSAYNLSKDPENEYLNISVKPAWNALEKLLHINPCDAENAFRQACGLDKKPSTQKKTVSDLMTIRKNNLGRSLTVSFNKPLKIIRGAMQYLYDEDGKTYLDTVNNVSHLGHCHPEVVKAGSLQMGLLNTNTRYLHDYIVEYAQELTAKLPDKLSVCHFVCTGSEANELALRMARIYTNRKDIVVVDHAYHGNTGAVIEISPYKFDGPGGKGMVDFVHKVKIPDIYRGEFKQDDPEAVIKYIHDVKMVLQEMENKSKKPAAFIAESVAGVAGQIFWPQGYLQGVYDLIRSAGGVCIADEVQIGFARIGTHFWGFETQDVIPDIVTMGKPIGNGHPLAAVVTTPEIADAFNNGMEYFNTFGGNPVSCAIGIEVLKVIDEEKLQEHSLETGRYLKEGLLTLKEKHQLIGDVRGLGLFIGIELVKDRNTLEPAVDAAKIIAERMKENGILISVDGPFYNVLKIKPPLVFNKNNADQYIENLDNILTEM